MDALLGLPRKKTAGMSQIHGHLFFGDQRSVNKFVTSSAQIKISKVLSDIVLFHMGFCMLKVLQ